MPAKPFKIDKAPPPLKTPSALAKERKLSTQEQMAIQKFVSSVLVAGAKTSGPTITIYKNSKSAAGKPGPKPRLVKGRAVARKK